MQQRYALYSALLFFWLIQVLGGVLRLHFIRPFAFVFKHWRYAHTHVALTGWVFAVLFLLSIAYFRPQRPLYKLFWASQLATLAMLISFPIQGYKAFSIAFSTLSILLSYVFVVKLWRSGESVNAALKWALFFLALSSFGPWSLGPLMVKMPGSDWYRLAIYFYLHFQYNGFFTLGLFALMHRHLELAGYASPHWNKSILYWGLSVLPAFALSAVWMHPPLWVWLIGGSSILLKVMALPGLWKSLSIATPIWSRLKSSTRILLLVSGLSFLSKLLMQSLSVLPQLLPLSENHPVILGYIHLTFLGFVSCMLLAFLSEKGWLNLDTPLAYTGLACFFLGLAGSELALFLWGVGWVHMRALVGLSALMPLGTTFFLLAQWKLFSRGHLT